VTRFADFARPCYHVSYPFDVQLRGEKSLESIYIIILINVLIFVGVRIQPDYVNTLALIPSEVWSHPWQIITSMFTHYDFTHILFNMWTFYFFGSAILQILGNKKFWLIYMIGGVAGGIVYVLLAYAGNALSLNWLGDINIRGYRRIRGYFRTWWRPGCTQT
jgi:membrane associated rhomboid family serine protease